MHTLEPTATISEGEFFTATLDGRKRTFEFIGEEGDHLVSFVLDRRTSEWKRTDVIEHERTGQFNTSPAVDVTDL